MKMLKSICKAEYCTACGCCFNLCPVNAIKFVENDLKSRIAKMDLDNCINCGMCVKNCPVNMDLQFKTPIECYALRTKDKDFKKISSSGGFASTIAKYYINKGDFCYGAKGYPVTITQNKNLSDIFLSAGSKYVESICGLIYRDVKEKLLTGRQVLFIGTPCQISGLKSFLRKKYENLLTIDLVCHGTPSLNYLDDYLKNKTSNIDNISFRHDDEMELRVFYENTLLYSQYKYLDNYYSMFLNGTIFRENCYHCKYAQIKRVSDITIGDFWGIQKPLSNNYDGNISLALINTDKGKEIFNKIKDLFIFEKRKIVEAQNGNEQLNHSSIKTKDRIAFEKNIKKRDFMFALKKDKTYKKILILKLKVNVSNIVHYKKINKKRSHNNK